MVRPRVLGEGIHEGRLKHVAAVRQERATDLGNDLNLQDRIAAKETSEVASVIGVTQGINAIETGFRPCGLVHQKMDVCLTPKSQGCVK